MQLDDRALVFRKSGQCVCKTYGSFVPTNTLTGRRLVHGEPFNALDGIIDTLLDRPLQFGVALASMPITKRVKELGFKNLSQPCLKLRARGPLKLRQGLVRSQQGVLDNIRRLDLLGRRPPTPKAHPSQHKKIASMPFRPELICLVHGRRVYGSKTTRRRELDRSFLRSPRTTDPSNRHFFSPGAPYYESSGRCGRRSGCSRLRNLMR